MLPPLCHPFLPLAFLLSLFEECGAAWLFLLLGEGDRIPIDRGLSLGGWVRDGHWVSVWVLLYKYMEMCVQCIGYQWVHSCTPMPEKVSLFKSERNGKYGQKCGNVGGKLCEMCRLYKSGGDHVHKLCMLCQAARCKPAVCLKKVSAQKCIQKQKKKERRKLSERAPLCGNGVCVCSSSSDEL